MSEAEYLISSRARTLSTVQKRKIRRGRRRDLDSSSLSGGSEITPSSGHPVNQHMIKIFNDMQAFQQSGLLNRNMSYASSTPMVNNMTVLQNNKNLKKPNINPRLIDHLFHNQLRIQDEFSRAGQLSPQQISPLLAPAPVFTPNMVTLSPPVLKSATTQIITVPGQSAVSSVPVMNHATNTTQSTDSRQYFHFPDPAAVVNQEFDHVPPGINHSILGSGQVTKQSSSRQTVAQLNHASETAKQKQKHVHYSEMPVGRYIVGNKQNSGYFEPSTKANETRRILQTDPNFIRCIPDTTGPTDLMGFSKNKVNLVNLPPLAVSNQGSWREEYHELAKQTREGNSKEAFSITKVQDKYPHISEMVPYAKLQPSPLSSSPASSIKNSPTLSNRKVPQGLPQGDTRRNGPKIIARQRGISPTSSNEQLFENEHGQVVVRNNRINRYVDNAKKLSYIKEHESSMSGESLDVTGTHKFGSNKTLKRSTELDVQEENEDEKYLPDLVKEIFSEMEETERRKPPTGSSTQNPKSATKKTSQDSGNPPSDSSDTSKPNTLPRKGTNLGAKALSHKKNSPQLEAVRKMDAMKKIGHKTRKYDAKLEDEEGTATLKFDRKTKTWKLEMKSAVNAQLFIQELNKKVLEVQKSKEEQPVKEVRKKSKEEVKKSKQMIANPNYVVGGAETPFVPILDPKAHALTDAECSPMIQPIQNRFPGTSNSGSGSGIHLAPGKKPPHIGYPPEDHSADDSSVSGYRIESPQYEMPKFPDENLEVENHQLTSPETALHRYKREKANYECLERGKEVVKGTEVSELETDGNDITHQGPGHSLNQSFNQNMAVTKVSLTVNATINANLSPKIGNCSQQLGHLSPRHPSPLVRPHPVMSPSHPAFQEELFLYGDDRSFPRSPGCEVGCMPCLVTPHAKLLKEIGPRAEDTESLLPALPAPVPASPNSQILDPNWELSSSGSDEESFFSDEDVGLISRRKSSADSVGILDNFTDRFMQFLEENKDSEVFGNAAKFLIEKAEENSADSGNSGAESALEEEPYIPQRRKIADDTLLALFKKEEHRKSEAEKKGCINPEDQKRKSEVEYLIKTRPLQFDQTHVIYEVDYQGPEATSVPRGEQAVNGAGTVRNAPPPQYNSLAELAGAKKQAALQKHREWEVKKAARMGVPVESLRNSDGVGSPGSAGSMEKRKHMRTKRRGINDKKKETLKMLSDDFFSEYNKDMSDS